jgi:hypothetical protein
MTEFERRQLIANRNELDCAHAEQTAPAVNGKRHRIPNSFIQQESELTSVNSLPAASKGRGEVTEILICAFPVDAPSAGAPRAHRHCHQ